MQRIIMWAFFLSLAGIVALTPAGMIYLFNEPPPVSYGKREVVNAVVPPGGTLKIQISADITKKCEATVYRTVIDGNGTLFELAPEPRPFKTNYTVEVPIPLGAAAGPSYYSARLRWRCNFVQNYFPQEVIQRPLQFTISPAEGQLPMPERQGIYEPPQQKSEIARAP